MPPLLPPFVGGTGVWSALHGDAGGSLLDEASDPPAPASDPLDEEPASEVPPSLLGIAVVAPEQLVTARPTKKKRIER